MGQTDSKDQQRKIRKVPVKLPPSHETDQLAFVLENVLAEEVRICIKSFLKGGRMGSVMRMPEWIGSLQPFI